MPTCDPSRLVILLPTGLKDEEYMLMITAQIDIIKSLLNNQWQALLFIYIGDVLTNDEGRGEDTSID